MRPLPGVLQWTALRHRPGGRCARPRDTAGKQGTYLQYDFTDVMVESIQWSGSSGGDDTPTESVSFAFAKVKITYNKQDEKTGARLRRTTPVGTRRRSCLAK